MAKKRQRVSYSLEPAYQDLFKEITDKTRRNMTEELRLMIDARAASLGLEPISHVDPKSSGLTSEMALTLAA